MPNTFADAKPPVPFQKHLCGVAAMMKGAFGDETG